MDEEEKYSDDFAYDEIDFEFELMNSVDGKLITLVCTSNKELTPDEYAQALRQFADRIESIITMSEASSNLIN